MTARLFPNKFHLVLDNEERFALDDLYEIYPHVDEVNLIHKALRAGIKAMNIPAAAKANDPTQVTRTEVEANKRAVAHALVERYLGFPISERVRRRLQLYLDAHPMLSEEDAAAFFLEQGLLAEEEMPAQLNDVDLEAIPNAAALKRSRFAARRRWLGRLTKPRASET